MKRKTWIIIGIVLVVVIVGYFVFRQVSATSAKASGTYQMTTIKRGDLTAIVGATGTVRANQSATLTWQTAAQIDTILVKLDDSVAAGQVLATLRNSSLPQTVILAQADLVTAKRALQNLLDSKVAQTQAQQALVVAQGALNDANQKRASKSYRNASDAITNTTRANYILAKDSYDKAKTAFDNVSSRSETDVMRAQALSALGSAQQKLDQALANLNYTLSYPNAQSVSEADSTILVAQAKVNDAQREWDRLKNGPDPLDVAAAQAKIDAIKATLSSAELDAPFAGTVTNVNALVGDKVSPGTVAFRIDDLSRMLVDVQVTEVDINRIQVDQNAQLTFDAIQGKTYNGKVVEVGRVGTTVQGVVNFNVSVELTDADTAVRPGMTSAVNLVVNQLNGILLVPNRAVRLSNGNHIVYILKNNVATPIQIQLGVTSDTNSELLGGDLKEGESIILNPPTLQFGPGAGGGGGSGARGLFGG